MSKVFEITDQLRKESSPESKLTLQRAPGVFLVYI